MEDSGRGEKGVAEVAVAESTVAEQVEGMEAVAIVGQREEAEVDIVELFLVADSEEDSKNLSDEDSD